MIPISDANFLVIDVETTGGHPSDNKIIDIACISVNNFEIVDTYQSLVYSKHSITWYIQKMTGIDNKMVKNAPKPEPVFNYIAKLLQQENTFFVAHNVDFDYSLVKKAIKELNIPFEEIPVICSLKLAKKVLPATIKKNVTAVSKYFNIPIINRHRAFDDALATANFFIEMLYIIQNRFGINDVDELLKFQKNDTTQQHSKVNQKLTSNLLPYKEIIPTHSGVLTFIDKKGNVLHIAKANNLNEHLDYFIEQCMKSAKNVKNILKHFHRLEWTETNNELETIITEHRKIKQFQPKYNFINRIDLVNANDIKINKPIQKLLTRNFSKIIFLENSKQEKTIDIYFIKNGIYKSSKIIGCKADITSILDEVYKIYFSDNSKIEIDIDMDMDEMKFINNWLNKNDAISKTIEIFDTISETILYKKVEIMIRNFYFSTSDMKYDDLYVENF